MISLKAVLHCKVERLPDTDKASDIKVYHYNRVFRLSFLGKQWSLKANSGRARRLFEKIYSPYKWWGQFEEVI